MLKEQYSLALPYFRVNCAKPSLLRTGLTITMCQSSMVCSVNLFQARWNKTSEVAIEEPKVHVSIRAMSPSKANPDV